MPQLAGKLTAALAVRGTIAKPTAKIDADIARLNLGTMQYDKFAAHVVYDNAQAVAKIDAHEVKGGSLTVDATLPAAASAPISATVRAQGFYIDLSNANLTNPRLVKGTLSAQIDAHGPRSAPNITGFVRFENGQLALADDPRLYTNLKIDIGIAPGRITLKNAEAKLGDGSVKANGYVVLNGLKPQSLELRAYARKFPIAPGNVGTFLDADVHAQGSSSAEGMTGTITIEKGTARLPALADVAGRSLQSTGPLPDVKFTDPEALRLAAKEKKEAAEAPTLSLAAKIPGPFHIRGKELSTDLRGNIGVDIVGGTVRVRGRVEANAGWIELLSRRYNIERLQVVLNGEVDPNPQLDVRITREMSQAMLIIEVHGTAKKPQLLLSSDPPIYDQSGDHRRHLVGRSGAAADRQPLARPEGDRRHQRARRRQDQRSDRAQPADRRHQGRHRRLQRQRLERPRRHAHRGRQVHHRHDLRQLRAPVRRDHDRHAPAELERSRRRVALQEALRARDRVRRRRRRPRELVLDGALLDDDGAPSALLSGDFRCRSRAAGGS